MRSFVTPLGYGLIVASFMASQVHLATAACTNTTRFESHSLESDNISGRPERRIRVKIHLDFISCPSSRNVSCTLPAKNYTLTIAPQFNISATNSSLKDFDWKGTNTLMDDPHVLDLPLNSSDRKAINRYMQGFWEPDDRAYRWHLALTPLTVTITSKNLSSYLNLTVEPGYSMTLAYKSFRATNWVRYAQCDNKSLYGRLIGAIMPYYNTGPIQGDTNLRIAGAFGVEKQFLNDTVPEDSSGIGLKAGSGWATTLIVFGVLAFNWL